MARETRLKFFSLIKLLIIHEGRGQLTITLTNGIINIQQKFHNTSLEILCEL